MLQPPTLDASISEQQKFPGTSPNICGSVRLPSSAAWEAKVNPDILHTLVGSTIHLTTRLAQLVRVRVREGLF